MAKDIDLNSSEWCDVVFDGKNKNYGAYKMRQTSSKRHLYAFAIVVLFTAFISVLPTLIKVVTPKDKTKTTMDEKYAMTDLAEPPKEEIVKPETPPPPPVQATQQYTPPKVVPDDQVTKDKEMKTADEVLKNNAAVGGQTNAGTTVKTDPVINTPPPTLPPPPPEKPLEYVEQMPEYPGGEGELAKFLSSNIVYPVIATENGIQGRVVIKFVVGKDGSVSNVEVVKSLDPSCDKEAVRVVKKMPKWVPGRQNGQPAIVYYRLPVMFRLQ